MPALTVLRGFDAHNPMIAKPKATRKTQLALLIHDIDPPKSHSVSMYSTKRQRRALIKPNPMKCDDDER